EVVYTTLLSMVCEVLCKRSFDSPIKSARAFDAAAFCRCGGSAKFNFPDQPPNIPGGRSLSPSKIQVAAAHYAKLPHSYSHHYFESLSGSVDDIAGPTETYNSTSSSSFHLEDNESHVMDYGIFLGLDDSFMRPPPIDAPRYCL
nr:ethylene-responsive transcription factor ERF017-like [Tanacetum cinerariifolium]